ncbi:MAG: serine hydroxymethyltransferase, partial [Anaerovoracaceae bacterium]
ERAKKLFGCEYVNIQPHSGAQANMAAFFAILEPGDSFMGMALDCGGHLTHGNPVNMSGKYFKAIPYELGEDGKIDYDEVEKIALANKPKLIVAGGSAYPRAIDFKRFREIADKVGAYLMADIAHIAGLIAGGMHQSSIPYAHVTTTTTHKTLRGPRGGMIMCSDEVNRKLNFNRAIFPGIQGGPLMHIIASKAVCLNEALDPSFKDYAQQVVKNAKVLSEELVARGFELVSGGTDNHLMLVDLRSKGVTGKQAEDLLWEGMLTCNKNAVPGDPEKPTITSGIRIGTPAITSRGMVEEDMPIIAEAMDLLITDLEANREKVQAMTKALTDKYPIY